MSLEIKDKNGLTEAQFLASYDASKWERPSVTVDTVCYCVKTKSILLVKRGGHPCLGKWALPGGFLEKGETTAEASRRELFEETGVNAVANVLCGVYSDPNRDPRTRIVTAVYVAVIEDDVKAEGADDADDARWFCVSGEIGELEGNITLKGIETLKISYKNSVGKRKYKNDPALCVQCSESIAFDHGKIIAEAMLKLKEIGVEL